MDERKKSEQKKNGMLNKFANALKKNKALEISFYVGVALLVIALYFSSLTPEGAGSENKTSTPEVYGYSIAEQEVEQRLANVLSNMKGAGNVQVMITYDTGPEIITAMSVDVDSNTTETSGEGKESSTQHQTESRKPATVTGSGGTSPIVLMEKQPSVRGVIVVAEGAADISVRLNLQRAVQTVLNVPISSIEIFERAPVATE